MREVPAAVPKIRVLIHYLSERNQPDASRWLDLIRNAYINPQIAGSMSDWAKRFNHQDVEALQANFDESDAMTRVWRPGVRNMVWNPMGVKFHTADGPPSDRRFNRLVTVAATQEVFIGYAKDFLQIVVYHPVTVDAAQKV